MEKAEIQAENLIVFMDKIQKSGGFIIHCEYLGDSLWAVFYESKDQASTP